MGSDMSEARRDETPGDVAASLATAALALARRFAHGGTLWCWAPGAPHHAQHVAVEFVHPVIVGTRALPAVALDDDDAWRAPGRRPRRRRAARRRRRRRAGRRHAAPGGSVGAPHRLDGWGLGPPTRPRITSCGSATTERARPTVVSCSATTCSGSSRTCASSIPVCSTPRPSPLSASRARTRDGWPRWSGRVDAGRQRRCGRQRESRP